MPDHEKKPEENRPSETKADEELGTDTPDATTDQAAPLGGATRVRGPTDVSPVSVPNSPGEDLRKMVDEGWKAEARSEKEKLQTKLEEEERQGREARKLPPADFQHLVSGIAAQVLMQLGEHELPMAGEKRVDLDSARYSIDILQMLEEKTKGNLTRDEERYLKSALHDLRMRFVRVATAEGEGGAANEHQRH